MQRLQSGKPWLRGEYKKGAVGIHSPAAYLWRISSAGQCTLLMGDWVGFGTDRILDLRQIANSPIERCGGLFWMVLQSRFSVTSQS